MSSIPLQLFSHYPSIPPPVPMQLWESPPHPCSYLPGKTATMRALMARRMPPDTYHAFMDANFRRSGQLIYQPACLGCRECRSLRVLTEKLVMSKSQRRCWRGNRDITVTFQTPEPTDEKFELYLRYLREWHGRDNSGYDDYCDFLYRSPVDTVEFEYRDAAAKLLAIGIGDRSLHSLSSVYFYFDPSESNRRLGTFGALWEIQWAAQQNIPFYYLGYFIRRCGSMQYKADFRPFQILCADGVWRDQDNAT